MQIKLILRERQMIQSRLCSFIRFTWWRGLLPNSSLL